MLGYACVANCSFYYHFTLNRTCLLNCPAGYFYASSGPTSKFCEVCQPPCQNCIDATKCLSCVTGFFFFNFTCSPSCPVRYFANPANRTCDNCVSPCFTCTSRSVCLSCSQGFWNGSGCTTRCSAGNYGENSTRACQPCDASCLTCTNTSISCTSCVSTLHLHNRRCISTCPHRFYSSGSVPLTCISCKPPC